MWLRRRRATRIDALDGRPGRRHRRREATDARRDRRRRQRRRFIANDLQRAGHEVLLIEQRPRPGRPGPRRPASREGVAWLQADACEVSELVEAGRAQADVVVAATGDDEDNLVISLLAKQEFGVPRVIARVNHPKNEWLFNENWGVDVSVSTPHLITALVEEAVSVGSLVRLLQFEGGQVAPRRGHPGRRLAGRRQASRRSSTCPATPPSWPSCARTTWSCPAATPSWTAATRCSCW